MPQDIIPSRKRVVRAPSPRTLEVEEDEPIEKVPIRRIHSLAMPSSLTKKPTGKVNKRKFSGIILTFCVIFLGIGIIAVALSLSYSKASVTITPKKTSFNVTETTFTAKKEAISDSSLNSGASIAYEVINASDSLSQTVSGTDGPLIQTKAKGTATLYNAQKVLQKILAGTRLSNDAGLIYRTTTTVTIPAGKTDPGSIAVGIVADQAGADYNMTLDDTSSAFKVVAYKGGPKYETVYGKIKTAVIGGFSGNKKVLSPQIQKDAVTALKDSVKTQLLEKIKGLVPSGYVMYDTAYNIVYESPEPVSGTNETAIITVKGTIYGVTFKKDSLLKLVAKRELDKIASPTYDTKGIEELNFSITNTKDFSPQKGTPLIFTLKGPISIVSTLSEEALKNELKGTYLKDSNAVFAHYPAIGNAYALITPFWMRSFPNSADKIVIEIKK